MKTMIWIASFFALAACAAATAEAPPLSSDAQIAAAEQEPLGQMAMEGRWNEPFAPFKVMDDIYYVGTAGVSSWLITTPRGDVLIDGGVPQTPPQIIANIHALGFDIRDVKYLLNSHAHFDHAGGLAALQRASGAQMVASEGDKPALEAGHVDYGPTAGVQFPPIRVDRVVGEGDTLSLGGVTLTAHMIPGHTRGCTGWSMDAHGADGALHHVFFHCSATVAGASLVPEAYPGMIAAYRTTFARVRTIEADVFLAPHAGFFDLQERRARQLAGDANAFVDAGALQRFNDEMERQFNEELARQQAVAAAR
ncbi:MAG TPA: subclass B3 metallo-beta-lactamase [Caulobacterales bacterium]|nr:subclass B3 metallo-beta-lactamase [Caulobacterales bacterium]